MKKAFVGSLVTAVTAGLIILGSGVASAAPAAPRAAKAAAFPPPLCLNIDQDFRVLCLFTTEKPYPDCHGTGLAVPPLFKLWACGPAFTPLPTPRCFNIDGDRNTLCVLGRPEPGSGCSRSAIGVPPLLTYWRCPSPPSRIGIRSHGVR